MITRIEDLMPIPQLIDELDWLGSQADPWITVVPEEGTDRFSSKINVPKLPPLLRRIYDTMNHQANELVGLQAATCLIRDGLKILRPSEEQAESLGQVSIDLELKDYEQPFRAVFVEAKVAPFIGCLCYRHAPDVLVLQLHSVNNENDIITMIRQEPGRPIEEFLQILDDECVPLLQQSLKCQRIALNVCLAMVNFGFQVQPAFPKQLKEDQSWAKEDSERGKKAQRRVKYALHRVDFTHKVVIRRSTPSLNSPSTGRTTCAHWVRGHWKMQPYGVGNSLRKRILIRPYLTHASQYVPDQNTVYVDKR